MNGTGGRARSGPGAGPAAIPTGLLVVDKPAGISSHGVVARARRLLGTRKVGHAGTLDPMATGVLVLGVGRATKLLGYISGDSKTYRATIRLGIGTVTEDAEGDVEETPGFVLANASESQTAGARHPVVEREGAALAATDGDTFATSAALVADGMIAVGGAPYPASTVADIDDAIAALTGDIQQVPSAVSAIKVDGKRAYALVRAGADVELKPRDVTVHDFHRVSEARAAVPSFPAMPDVPVVDVDVVADCSSGTYVRALARDLGRALGTAAHLTALRRTRVGNWTLDQARTLDQLQQAADQGSPIALIPIGQAVREQFPVVIVSDEAAHGFANGRPIPLDQVVASWTRSSAVEGTASSTNRAPGAQGTIVAACAASEPDDPFALVRLEGDKFRSVLHLHAG